MKFFPSRHELITPPALKEGDTIAIVAPARWVSVEEMQPAIDILAQWGLKTVVYNQSYKQQNQFAGTEEERIVAFQDALDNCDIKAILCARGGYGSIKLLPHLQFRNFLKNPKWIIGFSDITAIHSHVNHNVGVKTIHAPMALHFKDSDMLVESLRNLKQILFGEKIQYNISSHSLNRSGVASGILCGGNLSVLYSLRGTPADQIPNHSILFLEDLDEYLYHIDRMMMNLKYGGILKTLSGIIVGAFSDMKDNSTPFGKTAEEIILSAVKEYDFPVVFGFQAGHVKENLPLIMGNNIQLLVHEKLVQIL